ncbi:Clp protease ClpP [Streptomyces sp. DSM 42041]|uniref:ATP-dependent Clp protease proteolytic subunit n=1 Tax=Streptomyces hazeniae TaxID=3075538 RepID=A0ABU2NJR7_9ACTN|nr:head maturation protease, ClpP-related [Streptomyces sp. DSM 42041]MDT0377236.1 Clp protease ClpP [Streptomyces sp. DSM 42041]
MPPWITPVEPRSALRTRAQPRPAHDWYAINNLGPDEAEVLLYDEIGGWFGTSADDFVRELRDLTARNLSVRLNSPGGSVFEGIALANAIRAYPGTVTVYVDGLAASIASVIALAGDRLIMRPQSQLMIHDASGLTYGNAEEMREMAALLDRQSDNIAEAYADRAGGTVQAWRDRMRAETWYSAREAVAAGLADDMQPMPRHDEPEEEPEAPDEEREALSARDDRRTVLARSWDLSVFRYAGRDHAPTPDTTAAPTATAEPPAVADEEGVADSPPLHVPTTAAPPEQHADPEPTAEEQQPAPNNDDGAPGGQGGAADPGTAPEAHRGHEQEEGRGGLGALLPGTQVVLHIGPDTTPAAFLASLTAALGTPPGAPPGGPPPTPTPPDTEGPAHSAGPSSWAERTAGLLAPTPTRAASAAQGWAELTAHLAHPAQEGAV